jgi:glyoxylate/hydroxypyruvate reductase A
MTKAGGSQGRPKVLIASYLEPELVQRIAEQEPRVEVVYEPRFLPTPRYPCDHGGATPQLDPDGLAEWEALAAEAEIMFDFDWHEPATLAQRAGKLRFIQATSAGVGGFMDRTGLRQAEIEVATAGGIHAIPLAEFALTGALHFIKGIPDLSAWQREHHWERYTTHQLAGCRALVVGLGGMGRRVATTFAALGVEVWGQGRRPEMAAPDGVSRIVARAELPTVLRETDILIVCCPLTPETEGMIGRTEIDALPSEAVVVNIGRGPVIDQDALTDALRQRRILGACLDVFTQEPLPPDSPLWGMDNVLVSPHSASTVSTENAALVALFVENLGRYLDGRPLRNRYDPAAGY